MTDPPRNAGLVIRAPNHLGELILALPALEHAVAEERAAGGRTWVQVVEPLAPVLELAGLGISLLSLGNRRSVGRGARQVARTGARRGILLTPSASSAIIFRLAGLPSRRGTEGGWRTGLLTDPVPRGPLLRGHRVHEFLALVGAGASGPDEDPPAPRLEASEEARRGALVLLERLGVGPPEGPVVALAPGANGESRRWPGDRFAELGRRLAARRFQVLVVGGTGEAELTARVVRGAAVGGTVFDLGGRTSVVDLAAVLAGVDILVTNDTGPMHLAAALGRPLVALEGAADIRQTRPLGRAVRLVGHFDLPCAPCVKNRCPRRGPGTVLADARLECMRLITVDEVESAVDELLGGERDGD